MKGKVYRESNIRYPSSAFYWDFNCESADFVNNTFSLTQFSHFNAKRIQFDSCRFTTSAYLQLDGEELVFFNTHIKGQMNIASSPNLRQLSFALCKIEDEGIDLSNIHIADNKECKLVVFNTEVSKIKLNYINFILELDTSFSTSYNLSLYEHLLNVQKQNGFTDGYRKLDIEYRDYRLQKFWNVQDYFSKHWWNYGYNKEYIFQWTWKFFVVFFLIIFSRFPYFISRIYPIENLNNRWKMENRWGIPFSRKLLFRFWMSFFYSCIIFFGIKLDIERIKFSNIWAVIFIYLFYLLGVICVVFIGNYVLLK